MSQDAVKTKMGRPVLMDGYSDYTVYSDGTITNRLGKQLKHGISNAGYAVVTFCKDYKRTTVLVHRIVASTFLPNDENLREVNHKNEIKTDNRVENLEWCSSSYNHLFSRESYYKASPKGISNTNHKLTECDVLSIRKSASEGIGSRKLSKRYGVSRKTIWNIVKGIKWKHITEVVV